MLTTGRTATQDLTEAVMDLLRLSRCIADSEALNQVQYAILAYLGQRTESTLTTMSQALPYDLSVLSRHAAALADQSLVVRATDPNDARVRQISLTQAGRAQLGNARAQRTAMLEEALEPHTDTELETAARVLGSLNAVLSDALRLTERKP